MDGSPLWLHHKIDPKTVTGLTGPSTPTETFGMASAGVIKTDWVGEKRKAYSPAHQIYSSYPLDVRPDGKIHGPRTRVVVLWGLARGHALPRHGVSWRACFQQTTHAACG